MQAGTGKRPLSAERGKESIWEPRKVQRLLEMIEKEEWSTLFSADLPSEVLGMIFAFCHPFELFLPLVCKRWYYIWKADPVVGLNNPEYVVKCARSLFEQWQELEMFRGDELLRLNVMMKQANAISDEKEKTEELKKWNLCLDHFHETIVVRCSRWNQLMATARAASPINAWESAALTGNIRLLAYLKTKELESSQKIHGPTVTLLYTLASDGSPRIRVGVHGNILFHAVQSGNLEAVLWLVDQTDGNFDLRSARCAAEMKYWDILEFLAEHGAPCSALATAIVAKEGNLELLKKLRNGPNPAHWDSTVCIWGYAKGHDALVTWAKEHGCPCPITT